MTEQPRRREDPRVRRAIFAVSLSLGATLAPIGQAVAAILVVTDAAIVGGKLVVEGRTPAPNQQVTLDGLFTRISGANTTFAFSLAYAPTDCIVDLTAPEAKATAVVSACAPAGLALRGSWANAKAFVTNDLVTFKGSTWMALKNSTGRAPDTSPAFWELLAAKGPRGPSGPQGQAGPKGQKGDAGSAGEQGSKGPDGVAGEQGETGPSGIAMLSHTDLPGNVPLSSDAQFITSMGLEVKFGQIVTLTYVGQARTTDVPANDIRIGMCMIFAGVPMFLNGAWQRFDLAEEFRPFTISRQFEIDGGPLTLDIGPCIKDGDAASGATAEFGQLSGLIALNSPPPD